MTHQFLDAVCQWAVVTVIVSLSSVPVAAQTTPSASRSSPTTRWSPPRTADNQPDLQGVWDFGTLTPLERPAALGDKQVFSDEEAAAFQKEEDRRQNRDLIDPAKGGLNYPPGGVVPYNEFWYERGNTVTASKRTSLIVDPPDGRLPPLTPQGRTAAELRAASDRSDQLGNPRADSYTDRPLADRCLVGFNAGPPMTPGAYNNTVQLFQTAGHVVILNEMVHDARVVSLDGRPHLPPHLRQWKGDSRGRWEGDTLVVDTTNFHRETSLRGSTARMHLVERFTRIDGDTLLYEFTVDDATTWTRPWTAAVLMKKIPGPLFEYACHEGNYAMFNILSGARASEKAAASAPGVTEQK
ncbi:MAG: hypothetical protein EHM89_12735 [Acidobacteria bacterium]|nr:MAG: hypothetical protein EHM89_12735 [Acidobacteriota bacterium]